MSMKTLFYRSGDTITQFEGELVAHVSSELPSKDRWTEFDLMISSFDEWVLQGIGRTKVEGEQDRYWTIVSDDVADVLQGILGADASRLAKKLLGEAFKYLADCVCD